MGSNAEEFLGIMSRDNDVSEQVLNDAFQVLDKAQTTDPPDRDFSLADWLCCFMKNRKVELTLNEIEETIRQVKSKRTDNEGKINYEEFVEVVRLLKNPSLMDQLKRIYEALLHTMNPPKPLVLYGEPGVGKTWMARNVADHAIRQNLFDVALWIYLDRIYSYPSLKESIARQLSIPLTFDEPQDEVPDALKSDESELLKRFQDSLKEKKLLLIFDDDGRKMEVSSMSDKTSLHMKTTEVVSRTNPKNLMLYERFALDQTKSVNFLVTRRAGPSKEELGVRVMPLSHEEAMDFVSNEKLKEDAGLFIGKSRKFPFEILFISKTLSYFGEDETKLQKLRKEIQKLEKDKKEELSFKDLETLLINRYDNLPKNVLIDCFSSEILESDHFLNRGVGVTCNELIGYWILEGHLGHFHRVEDAFEEGHRVLRELLDCGLLRSQESGCVVPSETRFRFDVHEYYDFFRGIRLGLSTAFDCKLGKIAATNGMIRTVAFTSNGYKRKEVTKSNDKERRKMMASYVQEWRKMKTLILDGNFIGDVKSGSGGILDPENGVENLAIFNPTGKYLPLPVSGENRDLRLLVLRGCEFSENIGLIFEFPKDSFILPLPNLTVLEISGPSIIGEIPDGLFERTKNLKSINFSFLKIGSLPKNLYTLTKLETLILRGCSELKELGPLRNLKNLEVLDVAGCKSISTISDKRFDKNKKLRVINLSETKIVTLPLVHSLQKLRSISLNDCTTLDRIRKCNALTRLRTLDISGTGKVKEFIDPSLENLKVDFLDASKTDIAKLPSNLGNPLYLFLRSCHRLEKLAPVEDLYRLEVLDVSGSANLKGVWKDFFKNTKSLREINLSRTNVSNLSFLKNQTSLRKLVMSECLSLEKLGDLGELVELERMDFSGCKNLKEVEDNLFDKMEALHFLDLSGLDHLTQLPSLSKLINLKELLVKNCSNLKILPGLEEIPALEILDHSGTLLNPSLVFHPDCHPRVLGPISPSTDIIDSEKLLTDLGASNNVLSEVVTTDDMNEVSCNWSISNWRGGENGHSHNPNPPASGLHFLSLLKMYPSLLSNNFMQFNFLICPLEKQASDYLPDKYEYSHEISLREIYLTQLTQRKFKRFLEIRGFTVAPTCFEHLLRESELVVLVNNPFLKFLHDLRFDGIKDPKSCWIENCNEMEHVIGGNDNNNLDNMEVLRISDVQKLKSVLSLEIQTISFKCLKSLYLEFCPNLVMLCSSCSQLENLEVLYIKYCQNLGTLFSDDSPMRLDKLTALHLWGLPELKKVKCMAQSLTTLRIGECPSIESISILPPESQEIEFEGHEKLEILHVRFCEKLVNILETAHEGELAYLSSLRELEVWGIPELRRISCMTPSLRSLKIAECPLLESVGQDLVTENLEVLEVKCCDKLKTIEGGGGNMERVELLCLPELKSVGVQIRGGNSVVFGCPKLKDPEVEAAQ